MKKRLAEPEHLSEPLHAHSHPEDSLNNQASPTLLGISRFGIDRGPLSF
jgi:hypothetical protein